MREEGGSVALFSGCISALPTCYAMAVAVNHTALAIGFRILQTEMMVLCSVWTRFLPLGANHHLAVDCQHAHQAINPPAGDCRLLRSAFCP